MSASLVAMACALGPDTGRAASKITTTIEEFHFDSPDEISIIECPFDRDDVLVAEAVAELDSPVIDGLLDFAPDAFAYIHESSDVPPGIGCRYFDTPHELPEIEMTVGLAPTDPDAYLAALLGPDRRVVSSSDEEHRGGTLTQYVVEGPADAATLSAFAIWLDERVHVTLSVGPVNETPDAGSALANGLMDILDDVVNNLNDWRLPSR